MAKQYIPVQVKYNPQRCRVSKHIIRQFGETGVYVEGQDGLIGKTLVKVSEDFYRPTNVVNLWGDPTKAKEELSWNLQVTSFEKLIEIMVRHDIKKVAADHAASVMCTNLAEYLEKGI